MALVQVPKAEEERLTRSMTPPLEDGRVLVYAEREYEAGAPAVRERKKLPLKQWCAAAAVAIGLSTGLGLTVKGVFIIRDTERDHQEENVPPAVPEVIDGSQKNLGEEAARNVGVISINAMRTALFAATYEDLRQSTGKSTAELDADFQAMVEATGEGTASQGTEQFQAVTNQLSGN